MPNDGWIDVWPGLKLLVDPATGQARALLSAERQPDWIEFNLTAHRKPTALVHDGRVHHIEAIEQTPQGWLYTLAPWEGGVRVFRRVELKRETWDRERDAEREEAERRARWHWGPYLNWVVGFLPSHTQIALSHSHGVHPPTATIINAATSLLAASICLIPFMQSPNTQVILAFWMAGAMVRAMLWAAGHTACGPIPVEVIGKLLLLATGRKPAHEDYEELQ